MSTKRMTILFKIMHLMSPGLWFACIAAALLSLAGAAQAAGQITLLSIAPSTGSTAHTTNVTIQGTNFVPGDTYRAYLARPGSTVMANIDNLTVVSSTEITATVSSPNPPGPYDLYLVTPTQGTVTLANAFTLVSTFHITTQTISNAQVGVPYTQTIESVDATSAPRVSLASGRLPTGLTVSDGGISGTPKEAGTFTFVLNVSGGSTLFGGFSDNKSYTLTVAPPAIAIAPSTLPNAMQNKAYSQQITASGGIEPYTFSLAAGTLPAGLTLSSSGLLSGTPTTAASSNFTIKATDSSTGTGAPFSTNQAFTLNIAPADGSITFVVNSPDDTAYTFSSPAGFNLSVHTTGGHGQSATASVAPGTYGFSFTLPDGYGVSSATCTGDGNTINGRSKTGSLTVTAAEAITCTLDTVETLNKTVTQIGNFLENQSNLILMNEPDVNRRLGRFSGHGGGGGVNAFGFQLGGTGAPVSLAVNDRGASFAYDRPSSQSGNTSVAGNDRPRTMNSQPARFDYWAEGTSSDFDATGGKGKFGILHIGADYLVAKDVLVGLVGSGDWTHMAADGQGHVSTTGFLAGPYLTIRLSPTLYLDGRAGWGGFNGKISPFDTYSDSLKGTRAIVSMGMIGDYHLGGFIVRPEGRFQWFRETSDAYVDSLGVAIPSVVVSRSQFLFGPEFLWTAKLPGGAVLVPTIRLNGVLGSDRASSDVVYLHDSALDNDLRVHVETGVTYLPAKGVGVKSTIFYDGGDGKSLRAWGFRVGVANGF